MGQVISPEILRGILIWVMLTILFGALTSWIWAIRRLILGEPILPERPLIERGKPAWGWGILLVLVAFMVVNIGGFAGYTLATRGRPSRKHAEVKFPPAREADKKVVPAEPKGNVGLAGKDRPADRPPAPDADRHPPDEDATPGNLSWAELMFVQAAINSVLIVLLPLLLRLVSGARLTDLGISLRAWQRQVAIGVVAILMLMPAVYTVQMICLRLPGVPDEQVRAHPLQKMVREDPTGSVAYLAVLSAVILAPILEELLFRGILQTWLIGAIGDLIQRLRRRSSAEPDASPADLEYWAEDEPGEATEVALDAPPPRPADPGIPPFAKEQTADRPFSAWAAGLGIVLTSLVFASLHAPQWPAPVPLFLLSVGLGVVSHRTGSLLSPICMHAVFNGVSTFAILLTLVQEPAGGGVNPAPPPVERVIPLEKAQPDPRSVDGKPQAWEKRNSRQFILDERRPGC